MSTDDTKEGKGNGSANTVTLLVALIGAIVTLLVGFKDPIIAVIFGTPTPIPLVQVTQTSAQFQAGSPLQFEPCITDLSCPNYASIFEALGKPSPYNFNAEYSANISGNSQIRFSTGWCTKDQGLLHENLPHIQFVLAIDGVSYQDKLDMQYETRPTAEDPATDEYCYLTGVGISNWQSGVTYRIDMGLVTDTDLYDGWSTYPKAENIRTFVLTAK